VTFSHFSVYPPGFKDSLNFLPKINPGSNLSVFRAAQQFAHDSGSTVGTIRRASQGLFTITDLDPFTPEIKQVRVVTSVDYFLD